MEPPSPLRVADLTDKHVITVGCDHCRRCVAITPHPFHGIGARKELLVFELVWKCVRCGRDSWTDAVELTSGQGGVAVWRLENPRRNERVRNAAPRPSRHRTPS